MCTYLGTGSLISEKDIHSENIINHKISYLEGYLWDNQEAKNAMKKMVDIAKKDNQKISLTLSDKFCVDRHRDSFRELIEKDVDILFGNEEEINAMFESSNTEESINYLKEKNIIVAITKAEKGSVIVHNDKIIEIKPINAEKVLDTTGAGDLYAAGFLFGIANNKTLEESAEYASIAGSEIVSHFGTRPEKKLSSLI